MDLRFTLTRKRVALFIVCTALVLSGVAIGLTSNAYTVAHGAYHGCVGNGSGLLRVLGDGDSCRANEAAIEWNQAGIKGDKGDKGDTGATGATGAPGTAGTNGTNGTNGLDGTNGEDGEDGETAKRYERDRTRRRELSERGLPLQLGQRDDVRLQRCTGRGLAGLHQSPESERSQRGRRSRVQSRHNDPHHQRTGRGIRRSRQGGGRERQRQHLWNLMRHQPAIRRPSQHGLGRQHR